MKPLHGPVAVSPRPVRSLAVTEPPLMPRMVSGSGLKAGVRVIFSKMVAALRSKLPVGGVGLGVRLSGRLGVGLGVGLGNSLGVELGSAGAEG